MPSYAVNAVIDFPCNGSTGRATRSGHIDTVLPATAEELQGAIADQLAEDRGCRPDEVTFAEFMFTEIPTS